MMNKYVITDIHGCLKTFKALLEKIDFSRNDQLFLLGDYIDRGANSKGVIDYIWELQKKDHSVYCLRGNHEQMLLEGTEDTTKLASWLRYGGKETLESFAVKSVNEIPGKYIKWIDKLAYYFIVNDCILVHAGFLFDMPNPLNENHAMLWSRNWYERINYSWLKKRIIIHGHTPLEKTKVKKMHQQLDKFPVLNIDAGAVYGHEDLGHLCCINLKNRELTFQENLDGLYFKD